MKETKTFYEQGLRAGETWLMSRKSEQPAQNEMRERTTGG